MGRSAVDLLDERLPADTGPLPRLWTRADSSGLTTNLPPKGRRDVGDGREWFSSHVCPRDPHPPGKCYPWWENPRPLLRKSQGGVFDGTYSNIGILHVCCSSGDTSGRADGTRRFPIGR